MDLCSNRKKGRELECQVQMVNPLTSLGRMQQTSEGICCSLLKLFRLEWNWSGVGLHFNVYITLKC